MALLLFLVTPICGWVIFTDLKYMKIRNAAVLALIAVFALAGPFVLPFHDWLWRWSHLAVVLAIGVLLHLIAHFGAGDAKFAAAAAPFIAATPEGIRLAVMLLAAFTLAGFAMHRGARRLSALRRIAPDWVSWTRADFPLGIALAATLWTWLAVAAFH